MATEENMMGTGTVQIYGMQINFLIYDCMSCSKWVWGITCKTFKIKENTAKLHDSLKKKAGHCKAWIE